ncbi:MAG TPA: DUF4826 family protein [Planctomycetota bacterium]
MNEAEEEAWVLGQRKVVEDYLRTQGVDHGGVGEWPAFHVLSYVALWAVQSKKTPGRVGWWALSGDLPTDDQSSADAAHPRQAIEGFASLWLEAAERMSRGERHPDFSVGDPADGPALSDLLRRC